jgi:hypothetical protein
MQISEDIEWLLIEMHKAKADMKSAIILYRTQDGNMNVMRAGLDHPIDVIGILEYAIMVHRKAYENTLSRMPNDNKSFLTIVKDET